MAAKRWLKRIALALLALALVFACAITIALILVDTQDLRRVIENRVEAASGRALAIEGELDISLFPWLGFELGRTDMADAEGFGDEPFAGLDRAELRVEVLPLLAGRVALDRIVLHGFEVHLARDTAGRSNWADLAGEPGDAAAADSGSGEGDAAAPAAALDVRIEALELRDAEITWRDAASGRALSVSGIDITTGRLAAGEATPVDLRLRVAGAGLPDLELGATTDLLFEPGGSRIRLSGLDANLDARGDPVPGGRLRGGLTGNVDLDLAAGQARVEDLVLTAAGSLRATGSVGASFAESPAASGTLELAPFDPRALASRFGVDLPAPAGEGVLEQAAAAIDFRATPERIELPRFEARLDDTRLDGTARLEAGDVPLFAAELALDAIDLDAYLPEEAGDGASGSADGGGADGSVDGEDPGSDPVARLPLESLRGIRARLDLDAGRIGYRGLELRDARVRIRLADGILRLERAIAAAAGGRLDLSGRLDASTDTPAIRLSTEAGGISAEPLLTALVGTAPVLGRLDGRLTADTGGATLDAWTRALSGRFDATFRDGAVRGINLARTLRVAAARLSGGDRESAAAERRTDFSVLRLAGTMREGVVRSDSLDLRTPLLRVGGAGQADLGARTLDYTARILVTSTLAGQGGEAATDLAGLTVPVRFSGNWLDPDIDVRLDEALKARAERELEREKARAKKKLEREQEKAEEEARQELERERDKAEDKLNKELEGLFD